MEGSTEARPVNLLVWIAGLAVLGLAIYSPWETRWVYLVLAVLVYWLQRERGIWKRRMAAYQEALSTLREESEKQFRGAERRFLAVEQNLKEISDRLNRVMLEPEAVPPSQATTVRPRVYLMGLGMLLLGAGVFYTYVMQYNAHAQWTRHHAAAMQEIEELKIQAHQTAKVQARIKGEMALLSEAVDFVTGRRCEAYFMPTENNTNHANIERAPVQPTNCICLNDAGATPLASFGGR